MTALVSLLLIAIIPIDCKITNFSLYLYYNKLNHLLNIYACTHQSNNFNSLSYDSFCSNLTKIYVHVDKSQGHS